MNSNSREEYGIRRDSNYELLASETICHGNVIGVSRQRIRLPQGLVTTQDVIHLPPAVAIFPLLYEDGEPSVVMLEQFRNSVQGYMHEIPAGLVDEGEDLEDAARRELQEETGYAAGKMSHLASLMMIPGTSSHRLHYFLAEDLVPGEQNLDESECLQVKTFRLGDLVSRTLADPSSTVVVDGKTHLAILHVDALLRARAELQEKNR